LFEGTAQVQRLVISRMQRKEYRERQPAGEEHVLEQAPGTAAGSPVGDAEGEKEPAAA